MHSGHSRLGSSRHDHKLRIAFVPAKQRGRRIRPRSEGPPNPNTFSRTRRSWGDFRTGWSSKAFNRRGPSSCCRTMNHLVCGVKIIKVRPVSCTLIPSARMFAMCRARVIPARNVPLGSCENLAILTINTWQRADSATLAHARHPRRRVANPLEARPRPSYARYRITDIPPWLFTTYIRARTGRKRVA